MRADRGPSLPGNPLSTAAATRYRRSRHPVTAGEGHAVRLRRGSCAPPRTAPPRRRPMPLLKPDPVSPFGPGDHALFFPALLREHRSGGGRRRGHHGEQGRCAECTGAAWEALVVLARFAGLRGVRPGSGPVVGRRAPGGLPLVPPGRCSSRPRPTGTRPRRSPRAGAHEVATRRRGRSSALGGSGTAGPSTPPPGPAGWTARCPMPSVCWARSSGPASRSRVPSPRARTCRTATSGGSSG